MKVWYGYGSEHSMNLVMIGTFESAAKAEVVEDILDRFRDAAVAEQEAGRLEAGDPPELFSDELLDLVRSAEIYNVGPADIEQFLYEFHVRREGEKLVLATDESAVEGFLKVMLSRNARVEIYSAHDHKGTGYGRNT